MKGDVIVYFNTKVYPLGKGKANLSLIKTTPTVEHFTSPVHLYFHEFVGQSNPSRPLLKPLWTNNPESRPSRGAPYKDRQGNPKHSQASCQIGNSEENCQRTQSAHG